MDTSQWPQGIGSVVVRAVENRRATTEHNTNKRPNNREQQQANNNNNLNCPRCNSNNTKFCYYNNYSLSQPRYLCKACKRYWTEGGNLRSVPVGGASRRNKRPSSPSSSIINNNNNISSSKKVAPPPTPHQNPKTGHDINIGRQTLNLDFNPSSSNGMMILPHDQFGALPFGLTFKNPQNPQNPSFCSSSGFSNYNNYLPFSSLVTMPPLPNPSNPFFNMHDSSLKPSLGNFENNLQAASSSRIVFPFEGLNNNNKPGEQGNKRQQQGDHLNGDWVNGSW